MNELDHIENTSLCKAAEKGNIDVLTLLVEYGADINHRNLKGETAVMIAAKNGHKNAVNFLVENGADPEIRDYLGQSVNDFFDVRGIIVKKQQEENQSPVFKTNYGDEVENN